MVQRSAKKRGFQAISPTGIEYTAFGCKNTSLLIFLDVSVIRSIFSLFVIASVLVGIASGQTVSEDQLRELLAAGWNSPGPQAKAKAEAVYDQLPADWRATHALVLMHLKHYRYREAKPLLQEALQANPHRLPAREAMIWLALASKDYSLGLEHLDRLADSLVHWRNVESPDYEEDRLTESARFLGRMMAFLEGPAEDAAPANLVPVYKKRIVEKLPSNLDKAFLAGHERLVQDFVERSLKLDDALDTAQTEEAEQQVQKRQMLEQQKVAVAQQLAALAEAAEKASESLQKLVSQYDEQISQIQAQITPLRTQAEQIFAAETQARVEYDRWRLVAETTEDPLEQQFALRQQARWGNVINQRRAERAAVETQIAGLTRQGQQVTAQRQGAINRYEAQRKQRQQESSRLRTSQLRAGRQQEDLLKPATGLRKPKVRSLKAQLKALNTYEPFPAEREKLRLLDTFR